MKPSGISFLELGGMEVLIGEDKSNPIEPGVARFGGYLMGLVLNVEAMETVSIAEESGLENVILDLCGVKTVAVLSSKSGVVVGGVLVGLTEK